MAVSNEVVGKWVPIKRISPYLLQKINDYLSMFMFLGKVTDGLIFVDARQGSIKICFTEKSTIRHLEMSFNCKLDWCN